MVLDGPSQAVFWEQKEAHFLPSAFGAFRGSMPALTSFRLLLAPKVSIGAMLPQSTSRMRKHVAMAKIPPPEPLYSYSSMKGLLLLPKSAQKRHNVRVQRIVVARTDPLCFGEPFLQNLVFDFGLGPSSVAMNWLLGLNDGVGYILPSTGHIIDLARYASDYYFLMPRPGDGTAPSTEFKSHRKEKEGDRTQRRRGRSFLRFKLGVLGASSFLFFVTTTLVSFTLRETQDRMLNFTFQLQEHVRNRIPVGRLVATHVVENLVLVSINIGAIFFLIEFYGGDKFLAFMVLTLVWVSEVFSVISMRTHQGMTFFPRVVFLYFTLFHAYYFSCPFGFSYLSLTSSGFFITHSMLFFWNRFELPAILCESVTANSPRQTRREGNVRVAGISKHAAHHRHNASSGASIS